MKKSTLKRWLSIIMAVIMLLGMTACSEDSGSDITLDDNPSDSTTPTIADSTFVQATELSDPSLRYVMIYNPRIYDENADADISSLSVGALGSQVDVYSSRADGLEDEKSKINFISQLDWKDYLPDDIKLEGDRADPMGRDYQKGQTRTFYISADGNLQSRQAQNLVCNYAGEYCYIWTIGNQVAQTAIDNLGRDFDSKIYKQVTDIFGTPRFVGETGKVNILLYSLQGGALGYFAPMDLFTDSELPEVGLSGMNCNTGDAIININCDVLADAEYYDLVCSTMAHELQHLINFSAFFNTTNGAKMNTWLNESMSGYIENELYAKSKELSGHYISFNESSLIRNGQSLYNFDTGSFIPDVGVYGSVYYFSKYIEKISGKDVFSSIMEYWRDSYSTTLDTAEALANGMSEAGYAAIDNSIDYSALNLSFKNKNEEWMSKLIFNFYLALLAQDDVEAFEEIKVEKLLYSEINEANIEGGGRIIFAVKDGSFEIPDDADNGLVYVGLNEDFEVVTDIIIK